MSTQKKTNGHIERDAKTGLYRLVLVGGSTLKGKEVADVLNERKFPSSDVKLLDDDESLGQLEIVGDEMTFIQSVRGDQFEHANFAFFAGDMPTTRKSWELARDAGCSILDLSFALEEEPSARIRSPWVEKQLGQDLQLELQPGPVVVIAHSAAVVLALLVLRAQLAGQLRSVAATVFEPVSERGRKGIDELQEQSVNLLSFQELPQEVFDARVGFNLVRRYGEKSVPTVETVERRIVKHYQQIVGVNGVNKDTLVPAVALLQAPVFHGHSFMIFLETVETVALGDLTQALRGEHLEIARATEEPPSTVAAAGQDEILVSVTRDASNPNGFWIWAAADNLRVAARNAVECAESMAASLPKGAVQ
jgi:aspartate-semialdehyde dehydrogenase